MNSECVYEEAKSFEAFNSTFEFHLQAREVEQCNRDYLLKEFGISMSTEMVKVDGRVLPAPALMLGGGKKENPRDGSWDMRGKQFHSGKTLDAWAIVCFANPKWCNEDVLKTFTSQMARICGQQGIKMSAIPVAVKFARSPQEVGSCAVDLTEHCKSCELQI